jgi:hypothetical protein
MREAAQRYLSAGLSVLPARRDVRLGHTNIGRGLGAR